MCGLAAALLTQPDHLPESVLRQRGLAMATLLRHRGPDGEGCWTDRGVVLAHRRLAIIDTTAAADQPMHDQSGTVHVVFNGAIYNFRALRAELIAAGYRFRSSGDTEVIVNGYRAWGTGLFARLVGMFAIVLWDSQAQRLIAARDRFGEKPLHYMERQEGILFGSEIKAILSWPGVPRQPNPHALHDFLSFSYIVGTDTAFAGIKRLPPAHFMVCERGKAPTLQRYWQLPAAGENPVRSTLADLKQELIERIRKAVTLCRVADVPLGAFLSGGVDSSAVVSMMAPSHDGPIETFSSGFGFGDYDETRFARMVAERYGTNHHAFTYGKEIVGSMATLAWHYGEPFADSSALVTYALSRETRQAVTVALTGDGADETLLGYARYFRYGPMVQRSPPERGRLLPALYRSNGLDSHRRAAGDAYGFLMETFRERHKLVGYDLAMLPCLDRCTYDRLAAHVADGLTPEEQAGRIDLATYMPGDLLVKVDTAAMAHGLETRAPFLNHELVEWVSRIPGDSKVWDNEGKALLKSALEPFVPKECLYRPKVGFRVPVAKLMREDIREATESILLSERFADRRLIRRGFVAEMLDEHRTQRQDHGTRLWALLALEMWFRTWIDSDSNQVLNDNENPFAGFSENKPPAFTAPVLQNENAPATPTRP
ncbi:asparagine synthase (glutamine-hydrolyzing) [Reyranella sp.]|uniref:asparagine synthase (glutamine-hydrolyzing) n=1 Tax=Reyranella sp. TaxID=1929291 RepID=UPI00272F511A|nr:asparagine synthase (glutamine-hydrolyzing) [Reyranella sp.]MDP2372358.1 asparagine synthase (glutamine-hydrolyzing) [Reyranella sp.]